jgi:hypothetical protein
MQSNVDRTAIREMKQYVQWKVVQKKIFGVPGAKPVSTTTWKHIFGPGRHILLALLSSILLVSGRGTGHIPKPTLVSGERSVVPHVDQDTR